MKKVFPYRVNRVFAAAAVLLSLFLFSCAFVPSTDGLPGNPGSGSSANLTISLEAVSKTSIVITAIPIVFARITLVDPAGGIQTAVWTNGCPLSYVFHSDLSGMHTINFLDIDSNNFTNQASTTIDMIAGYNYYVSVQLGGSAIVIVNGGGPVIDPGNTPSSLWIATVQDQYHSKYSVYDDASSAGNNFNYRGYMGNISAIMREDAIENPRSGLTCIQASVSPSGSHAWSGCYFLNGILTGVNRNPQPNWGTVPNAGIDLRGATRLTFWARGETGTEQIEFFALGVARDTNSGAVLNPYPDSATRVSTGVVTLTTGWKEYTIDLTGSDLSYVLGGFGWSAVSRPTGVIFYMDDISYDLPRTDAPRFPVSFKTIVSSNSFDLIARNASHVYDASLAIMAFLACGEKERARLIADALVYAQDHDRYYTDGRLRNAYQAGELTLPKGWNPNGKAATVRMPGYWDSFHQNWYEDEYTISTSTGNIAWAMLSLLAYYQSCGGQKYLESAKRMGEWVVNETIDIRGNGGFIAGKRGWEPVQTNLSYKSTEHNLDLYAAFARLYQVTGQNKWQVYANYARTFVMSMWDTNWKCFLIGTDSDGVSPYTNVIPTDVQAWVLLSLRDLPSEYDRCLEFIENNNSMIGTWGFDFSNVRKGIWYEGTAQMAAAYRFIGQFTKYANVMNEIENGRAPSGAIYATDRPSIFTGLLNMDGSFWYYFRREHLGATAWQVIADKRVNPFWQGTVYGAVP